MKIIMKIEQRFGLSNAWKNRWKVRPCV